jgi:hypothetical protein
VEAGVARGPEVDQAQDEFFESVISSRRRRRSGGGYYETTYGNIAPRLGVAYRHRARVLRAGFGTFYDLGQGSLGGTSAFFPYSASKTFVLVPFPLSPENAAAPTPTANPPVNQIVVADPHLRLPRTYEWNVAVEQSLGHSQLVSLTYVGAAGRDLLRVTNLFNPNPQFEVVSVTSNTSTSDYHALQAKYDRRLSNVCRRSAHTRGRIRWTQRRPTRSPHT